MQTFSYHIVDYDLPGPQLFWQEKSSIVAALGIHSGRVEYIGSTEAPSFVSKRIIVTVESSDSGCDAT